MRRSRWLLLSLSVLALAAAPAAARPRASVRPVAFASCADLTGYAQRHFAVTHGVPGPGLGLVGAPALGSPVGIGPPAPSVAGSAPAAAAPSPAAGGSAPAFSTTNNQEAGVDEPDIAKTDGRTLFTTSGSSLYAVPLGGSAPRLAGSLDLGAGGYGAQLFLRGSRLIVISSGGFSGGPVPAFGRPNPAGARPSFGGSQTTVSEVDVHDPSAMRVTRTMTVDGSFVDGRQNGATARLVIRSAPGPIALAGERARTSAWVPSRHFHSALTGRSYVRPVAPCRTIRRPVAFSGLGMLTIFTLDLDRGLYTADTAALMADAQVVYGSTGSLYVATQKWLDPRLGPSQVPPSLATVIDRFDVSDPARTPLVASGEVPGYLLNQYSLSEYRGYLRVATTSRPVWWGGGPPTGVSQSAVTVLAQSGGGLVAVGRVGGLGAGQQIYSVRFVADTGYVVTFRQVDPLYTIDLRAPTAPRVAGQLELAGYSAYLHPLAPGLLLGIGQAVGAANEPAGTQLELFDVSDPAVPRLVQRIAVGDGSSSEVQYDPHAFLFWPPTGLAVLPVSLYSPVPPVVDVVPGAPAATSPPSLARGFLGAIGYHVDAGGLVEVGRIAHPANGGYPPAIRRSIVVGDGLYTISLAGVLESSLASLAPVSFVAFPPVRPPPPLPLAAVGGPPTLR